LHKVYNNWEQMYMNQLNCTKSFECTQIDESNDVTDTAQLVFIGGPRL
jgi:hypothetical protein